MEKSNVRVHNCWGEMHPERVGGIGASSSVRYLGPDLGISRQCFSPFK